MEHNTNYYVGVLLSASRNNLNKIEFFLYSDNHRTSLFSRVKDFDSHPYLRTLDYIGDFSSPDSVMETINSARQEMATRGLAVPGVSVYTL